MHCSDTTYKSLMQPQIQYTDFHCSVFHALRDVQLRCVHLIKECVMPLVKALEWQLNQLLEHTLQHPCTVHLPALIIVTPELYSPLPIANLVSC